MSTEPTTRTLTLHFAHPHIEPIIIEHCEEVAFQECVYVIPSGSDDIDKVVETMVSQSEGALHVEWDDSIDGCVMFNTQDARFTIWTGNGDLKGRGFHLDSEHPMPFIERIDVATESVDGMDEAVTMPQATVEKCGLCHLFIHENETYGDPTLAPYLHSHRGDEADEALDATHEAQPSGQIETLATWMRIGPPQMLARFHDSAAG